MVSFLAERRERESPRRDRGEAKIWYSHCPLYGGGRGKAPHYPNTRSETSLPTIAPAAYSTATYSRRAESSRSL